MNKISKFSISILCLLSPFSYASDKKIDGLFVCQIKTIYGTTIKDGVASSSNQWGESGPKLNDEFYLRYRFDPKRNEIELRTEKPLGSVDYLMKIFEAKSLKEGFVYLKGAESFDPSIYLSIDEKYLNSWGRGSILKLEKYSDDKWEGALTISNFFGGWVGVQSIDCSHIRDHLDRLNELTSK